MKNIVIIGGGFAGAKIAKALENYYGTVFIDDKDYFEFTPGILKTIV
ncbi:FAD-dependent oxidoreductase, partial [Candidatus Pacearchaeota archaeon CG_4_10_14_0_2_um_filter_05_32_18]